MKTLSTQKKSTAKKATRARNARVYRRTASPAASAKLADRAAQWRWQNWLAWARLWNAARVAAKTAAMRIWHY